MARRSPANPRYRKDAQFGVTRRSAASAKPKREAGEAPRKPSGGRKSGGKAGKGSRVPFEPDTPEFKRWRKIWLGLLIAAMLLSAGALALRDTTIGNVSLGLAYATLLGALWVDFAKIRRMRKEWRDEQAAGSKKENKTTKAEDGGESSGDEVT